MNEAINFSDLCHLFYIGLFLVAIWSSTFVISGAYALVWGWLDDDLGGIKSPLNEYIRKKFGWEREIGPFMFYRFNSDNECIGRSDTPCLTYWFWFSVILIISPFLVFKIPTFTLVALCAVAIAFSARFIRRYSKLLKQHMEDKDAHK